MDRRGRASLDLWHMDIRRFGRQYRSPTPSSASARPTRPTTTSSIRTTSASPAVPCGFRRPTPGTASTMPPSARSRAGSGSTGTRPTLARETMTCARAAGPGATGRRPSAPSTARAGRRRHCSTRARSPSSSSPDRAPPSSSSGSATTGWPATWPGHLHPDAQPRAASSATSPWRAWRRTASGSSRARHSAITTASGSAVTCPGTARCRCRT